MFGRPALLPICLFLSLAATATADVAETSANQVLRAIHADQPPNIDGRLTEAVWQQAEPATGFRQQDPEPGAAATQATEVFAAYDHKALYIGARMHCDDPAEIVATVSRRDNVGASERIIVSLDTYRDRRTAYSFALTATGVRADYYHASDAEFDRDYTFNPVWEAATQTDPDGWTAELRIPFSQLRFNSTEEWGVNFNRWVPARNEDDYWVYVDRNETGWASRFGALIGISGVQATHRIEIRPYAASATHRTEKWSSEFHSGLDFKMGIGPNLTLDGTVNPDFGQVEADPAEVNLSAFETFFAEKRPFFTEGSQLLRGDGPNYYYSRRIGATPHGAGSALDAPDHTTILGAAKLTGRLKSGLSLGALAALTQREYDRDSGSEVEPGAVYGVFRAQQEFGAAQSTAGFMLTAVERDFERGSPLPRQLVRHAYSGGADWNWRLRDGEYAVSGYLGFSHLRGKPAAITAIETSSAHYFQRPDATHVVIDTTRETFSGVVAAAEIERQAGKHWLWSVEAATESPEFEINDLGRLHSADNIEAVHTLTWRENHTLGPFRRFFVTAVGRHTWNYGGDHLISQGRLRIQSTWKNFWSTGLFVGGRRHGLSDDLTRGGPLMGLPRGYTGGANIATNPAGDIFSHAWIETWWDQANSRGAVLGGGFTWRLGDRWELGLNPFYSRERDPRQYLATLDDGPPLTYGKRYIFGTIERTTLSLQTRVNFALTPDVTLEIYAEPFAASGHYLEFGQLEAPGSSEINRYGANGTDIDRENGLWHVTTADSSFSFRADDFRYHSFRSSAVARWEWRPGSTLFLVWQVNRSNTEASGKRVGPGSLFDGLTSDGDQYFGVKIDWWFTP